MNALTNPTELFTGSERVKPTGNQGTVIGLGNDVSINCTFFYLTWKTLHLYQFGPMIKNTARNESMPRSRKHMSGAINSSVQLFDEHADMEKWGDDFFDMLIIHRPADGSTSETYKHLIRVARQGMIILN